MSLSCFFDLLVCHLFFCSLIAFVCSKSGNNENASFYWKISSALHIMHFANLLSGPICGKADLFHYPHESDCRKYGNYNHVPLGRF